MELEGGADDCPLCGHPPEGCVDFGCPAGQLAREGAAVVEELERGVALLEEAERHAEVLEKDNQALRRTIRAAMTKLRALPAPPVIRPAINRIVEELRESLRESMS